MFYYYCKITTIRARTLCGLTTSLVHKLYKACEPYMGKISTQVHNVDGPHERPRLQSTKWTDPTRVKNLYKSKTWTDTTRGQDLSPQSGQTPHVHSVDGPHEGSRLQSTTWTDPTRGQDLSPQSGRNPHVHNVDGPHEGSRLQSTTWTDPTRGQDQSPQRGQTPQGPKTYTSPQSRRTPRNVKIPVHSVDGPHKDQKLTQVHKVDGRHKGSNFQSLVWTDPIRIKKYTSPQSGRTPLGLTI